MVTDDLLFLTSTPQALHVGMRLRVGQVIACVGGGSTGYVYRVQDEIGGLIAVREYFPSAIALRTDGMVRPQPGFEAVFQEGQRLFDEDGWQLAAQDHPGLVKVHQVWSERGTSYLAMPWCEGHTLGQIVRASPMPPSQAQICIWLRAIADALSVIHRRRGVHGNLSLDQVMLLGSGRLLLMEFARARRAVARDPRDIERDPFAALECGTDPRCGPVGAWTDVYAIAAMLHFMLRGRAPQAPVHRAAFDAQEPLSQIKALVAAGYSEEFLHGIDRGLAVRARARPQSLPEFLALLGLRERRSRQRATGESLLINLPVSDAAPPVDESTAHASVASPGEVIDVAVQPEVSAEHEDTVPVEPEEVDEPVPSQADAQPEPATARSAPWPTATVPTLTEPVEAEAEARARAEVEEDEADASVPPAVPVGTPHFARQQRPRMSATLVMACVAGLGAMAAFGGAWLAQADLAPEALSKIQLPTPAPQQARDAARMARADAASQASAAGASSPIPDPMEPTAAGPTAPAPADRIEPSFQAVPALGSASPEAATGASAAPEASPVNISEPSTPTAPVEAKPSAKRPAAAASPPSNSRSGAKASESLPAEAQPPTSRVIEEATDASALSRRCPELLARQYTGPPLGAAERELVRTQCR